MGIILTGKKIQNVMDKPLRKRNRSNGFKANQTRPNLNRLDPNLPIETFYDEQLKYFLCME